MRTLLEYQQDIAQAERVRRLVVMSEYGVLETILKRIYDRDVDNLLNAESSEARTRIRFIKDLKDEIQADIDRGTVAKEAIDAGQYLESPQGG